MLAWIAPIFHLLTGALLPLLRISGLMVSAPIFGQAMVPVRVRVLLALTVTAAVAPLYPAAPALLSIAWWRTAFAQVVIGLLIGLLFRLIFEGVLMGAEAASLSTGLSFAQMASPAEATPTAAFGTLYTILATLAFLAFDGHLLMLKVLVDSLQYSAGPLHFAHSVLSFGGNVLAAGILLAAPVIAAMLGVYLATGAMSKAAPALNIFAVGFPAALMIGLIALGWSLNGIPGTVARFTRQATAALHGGP
ncbi:MAG: flagellar biosynthetic protein FliR [Rhodanobacteraceae bacterium]